MEKTQNITLSIPKDILRKAKILAIEKARRRNLALLQVGLNLGTQGNLTWKRAELHERHTGE
jgi:hypothetical protein